MLEQKLVNKIKNTIGSVAAAKTLTEEFNAGFLEFGENSITCSFDLISALMNLISDEPLDKMIISFLSDKLSDPNCTWLQGIEETVKLIIETNITNLITCQASPLIPDKVIGSGEFYKDDIPFSNEGITVPISEIDFTNVLSHCPNDKTNPVDSSYYFGCKDKNGELLQTKDLWKTDDFNAFLWYTKNKGVYSNLNERRKLIWDNRYKSKPYSKYERKDEDFFTVEREDGTRVPFDREALEKYNNSAIKRYKKRQILECRYIDGDGRKSDSFQFRLPASNYYKAYGPFNKTLFEFNHEFLMSLKLFDPKVYLSQVISSMMGQGNFAMNFSISYEEGVIDQMIEEMITNVIRIEDTEVNDCYFTFSEDDYQRMLFFAENKRKNYDAKKDDIDELHKNIDGLFNGEDSTFVEDKVIIDNILTHVTSDMKSQENELNSKGSWGFDYNYKFELLKMFAYPLVKPLFSPKIMTLFYINFELMGNPVKEWENGTFDRKEGFLNDIKPFLSSIGIEIIKEIWNIILELLYKWVIEYLTPIIEIFVLKLIMEQINIYKTLIEDMITACFGLRSNFSGLFGNKSGIKGEIIDNVDYVDIDPRLEKLKQTPVSNSNC